MEKYGDDEIRTRVLLSAEAIFCYKLYLSIYFYTGFNSEDNVFVKFSAE